MRHGADLGVRDSGGANAFHYAASEGHIKALAPLIAAAKDEGAGSLARYLAQGDAKRYTREYARARAGSRARTSERAAARAPASKIAAARVVPLTRRPFSPSLLPPPFPTALHWAAQYGGGAPDAARMLLKAGAKVDARAVKCVRALPATAPRRSAPLHRFEHTPNSACARVFAHVPASRHILPPSSFPPTLRRAASAAAPPPSCLQRRSSA